MASQINIPNFHNLSTTEIIEVLNNAPYCLLGVAYNHSVQSSSSQSHNLKVQPLVFPMNYTYRYLRVNNEYVYTFTLHSLNHGQKIDAINDNDRVCLEFNYHTSRSRLSVMVTGTADVDILNNGLARITIRPDENGVTGRKFYTSR